MSASPIPEGYHSVTPYLICNNAGEAIEFYKKAFGATETMRLGGPGGKVMHGEFQIGDSRIMIADEFPEINAFAPQSPGSAGVGICVYVEKVDEVVAQATEAGATIARPLQDQFYGDRSATLHDPYGHVWTIATHVEDLSNEEIQARMNEMMQG